MQSIDNGFGEYWVSPTLDPFLGMSRTYDADLRTSTWCFFVFPVSGIEAVSTTELSWKCWAEEFELASRHDDHLPFWLLAVALAWRLANPERLIGRKWGPGWDSLDGKVEEGNQSGWQIDRRKFHLALRSPSRWSRSGSWVHGLCGIIGIIGITSETEGEIMGQQYLVTSKVLLFLTGIQQ